MLTTNLTDAQRDEKTEGKTPNTRFYYKGNKEEANVETSDPQSSTIHGNHGVHANRIRAYVEYLGRVPT